MGLRYRTFEMQAVRTHPKKSLNPLICIIHTINSAEIIKRLQDDGWGLRGVKGSHHVFTHPTKPGHISVPQPRKDLGIGLVNKLLKQAGLK